MKPFRIISAVALIVLMSCQPNGTIQDYSREFSLIPFKNVGKIISKSSSEITSSPFGIQADTLEDSLIARAAEIGVKWTRLGACWSEVEEEKGAYSWENTDKAFEIALKNETINIGAW
ncbi:MAG: hypothetical protein K9H49_12535 [Bacteroidales bacterium]|nr:hypothetical protein [Bacteroidales bacterium]